jgi:predicted metal-dependent hydrolase
VTASSHLRQTAAPQAGRRIVDPRGRAKVFRPLPAAEREAAIGRALAAYAAGAFYLAHEEMEQAWMATEEPGERELLGGLIKLAAAQVHAARGNPAGAVTNLRGAQIRLAQAAARGASSGFDLPALLAGIEERLARASALPTLPAAAAGTLPDPPHEVAGPAGRARRPPLDLAPVSIAREARG